MQQRMDIHTNISTRTAASGNKTGEYMSIVDTADIMGVKIAIIESRYCGARWGVR